MDAVDRMFQVLVRTLRSTNPSLMASAFSVGDLHQQIMPYRHFRRELGLETNQEYEITLMELLSGARGYLDVDERLRDGLTKELASGSPEPSRVREYAEAQISLNPAAIAKIPDTRVAEPAHRGHPATDSGAKTAAPAAAAASGACRYCSGQLPAGRMLNYCPHCGQNLQVHNCPACGAELDAGWKFCVACGKTVS